MFRRKPVVVLKKGGQEFRYSFDYMWVGVKHTVDLPERIGKSFAEWTYDFSSTEKN